MEAFYQIRFWHRNTVLSSLIFTCLTYIYLQHMHAAEPWNTEYKYIFCEHSLFTLCLKNVDGIHIHYFVNVYLRKKLLLACLHRLSTQQHLYKNWAPLKWDTSMSTLQLSHRCGVLLSFSVLVYNILSAECYIISLHVAN